MMRLRDVRVSGLWGNCYATLNLERDVNFLIGINGTGKTTLMNLIGAALTRNYKVLSALDFGTLVLSFKGDDGERECVVRVSNDAALGSSGESILYNVQYEEKSDMFEVGWGANPFSGRHRRINVEEDERLKSALSPLGQIVWLTIHRARYDARPDAYAPKGRVRPLLDLKLEDVSSRLTRYFMSLESEVHAESLKFQRKVLMGLVKTVGRETLDYMAGDEPRAVLGLAGQVFEDLGVSEGEYQPALDGVMKGYVDFCERKSEGGLESLSGYFQMGRLADIVSEWDKFRRRRDVILEKKEMFVVMLNHMYQGKGVRVSDVGEVVVTGRRGRGVALMELSSGEKQLVILLGEALLRSRGGWLYIADEPELSMHVAWQSSLVDNVRALSPGVQILFATHSPDLVAGYGSSVRDMEDIVDDIL